MYTNMKALFFIMLKSLNVPEIIVLIWEALK
ncbi:hypothetical protein CLOSAC_42700 [Clostridium saccharobutylicum]|uniref:Uncharacterized protein n=1 Tax=Clostridium saccharobutylicum TaxID=169679 RepID=A0A1S8MQA1_CLOSA|nr:hypothetical protein CLOSAC_42700 [Clostridium saccharobutylicum]